MGKRKVRAAVLEVAHHAAHTQVEMLAAGMENGQARPVALEGEIGQGFCMGLIVGAKLGITDIVAARRLVAALTPSGATSDGVTLSDRAVVRLLEGLD